MSLASKLKKLSRKVLTLSTGDELVIRKVLAGEVTARTGTPITLLGLISGHEGETDEERNARLAEELQRDPEMLLETMSYNRRVQSVVVSLGCVNLKVVGKPYEELAEDEIRPEDLGGDFSTVYNEIVAFSGLPYAPVEVADMSRFSPQQVGVDSVADGERTQN